jgi:hypothetical protein
MAMKKMALTMILAAIASVAQAKVADPHWMLFGSDSDDMGKATDVILVDVGSVQRDGDLAKIWVMELKGAELQDFKAHLAADTRPAFTIEQREQRISDAAQAVRPIEAHLAADATLEEKISYLQQASKHIKATPVLATVDCRRHMFGTRDLGPIAPGSWAQRLEQLLCARPAPTLKPNTGRQ